MPVLYAPPSALVPQIKLTLQCHRRFKRAGRIACIIVAVAIVVNFITVLSLFLTSWDSTPLDVYALVVSTLFFGTLMLGGVFWMGVKKGRGELEGEGRILLGQEEA
jgi:hypothetical protein